MEIWQLHLNILHITFVTEDIVHLQDIKLKTIPKFNKIIP